MANGQGTWFVVPGYEEDDFRTGIELAEAAALVTDGYLAADRTWTLKGNDPWQPSFVPGPDGPVELIPGQTYDITVNKARRYG
jgi:hypothetical protein